MSITVQHTQENLSRAHIQAIAAVAGVNLAFHTLDYGVDGQFDPVTVRENRRINTGFSLQFQSKATVNWEARDGAIVYDLEAKSYNDMAMREEAESTLLLILLCLPRDIPKWYVANSDSTMLSHCCYWHVISGELTTNQSTKTIHIPDNQILNPESLLALLEVERYRRINACL